MINMSYFNLNKQKIPSKRPALFLNVKYKNNVHFIENKKNIDKEKQFNEPIKMSRATTEH